MSGVGSRVSIPSSARKTIQNIREITGGHSDEEIYAMLKECSMDPNETTQKLLLQDTFHEVKRKRDKRKEVNRELADSRWRPGPLGRGGRGVRGNNSSRYLSQDTAGGRGISSVKENGVNQGTGVGITSASVAQNTGNKSTVAISGMPGLTAAPSKIVHPSQESGVNPVVSVEESSISITNKIAKSPSDGIDASATDPLPVASLDANTASLVGTIELDGGSQRPSPELTVNKVVPHDVPYSESPSVNGNDSLESSHPYIHGATPRKIQEFEGNQSPDNSQFIVSSSLSSSTGSRPSSNYSSRSQHQSGAHKGPTKEWKPKSTNTNISQASGTSDSCDVQENAIDQSERPSACTISEGTSKIQKKFELLQFSEAQHVIIPNHLQVPESERIGLSFGSFDANFGLSTKLVNDPDSDKVSLHQSEASQETEENIEEPFSSNQIASPTAQETEYTEPHSPDQIPKNMPPHSPEQIPDGLLSKEPDLSSVSAVPEYDHSKPETAFSSEISQHSVAHTVPGNSNFGIVPPILGHQFSSFEGTDQARDAPRVPSFVVQQPFDPSTFYTQIYRPSADGDSQFSPFLGPGAAKYNGNIAALPPQTGQSPQEMGNSMVLPSTASAPIVTQAAGVMHSSLGQQAVPVFRQPAGLHMSHFPPNYIPYNQYYSPFYVPPQAVHHYVSNTPFAPQPPTGGMYPPSAATPGSGPVKYSITQYKPAANSGNPISLPTGYGTYSSSTVGYNPPGTSGNSTVSDDLNSSHNKENSAYATGVQQSDVSTVWVPATGRDISALQASSFYNLPPGQHVTYTPTQAGHAAFTGMYHPNQPVAAGSVHPMLQQSQGISGAVIHPMLQQSQSIPGTIEMSGPPTGVYQQPQQRTQMNWVNNF